MARCWGYSSCESPPDENNKAGGSHRQHGERHKGERDVAGLCRGKGVNGVIREGLGGQVYGGLLCAHGLQGGEQEGAVVVHAGGEGGLGGKRRGGAYQHRAAGGAVLREGHEVVARGGAIHRAAACPGLSTCVGAKQGGEGATTARIVSAVGHKALGDGDARGVGNAQRAGHVRHDGGTLSVGRNAAYDGVAVGGQRVGGVTDDLYFSLNLLE